MDDHTRKMHLVAERYWELQGLREVLVGTGWVLGAGGTILLGTVFPQLFADPAPDERMLMVLALALLLIAPGMMVLDRFYARRFGRMKPTAAARRFGLLVVPLLLIPGMVMAPYFGAGAYVAFFIGWAVVGAWIAIRDWPLRTYHLLDVAAGVPAAVVLWKVSAERADEWGIVWGFLVIGTAAVVTGFRDHQLLATTLRGGGSDMRRDEIKV